MFSHLSDVFKRLRERHLTISIPFPVAHIPEYLVDVEKQHSFERVAKSVCFNPAELFYAQLLEFFKQEDIKLYDYGQVSAWLTSRKNGKDRYWRWRPLREKDISTYGWGYLHIYSKGY